MTAGGRECGDCALSRRHFVERGALAALGTFLLGACGDGEIGGPLSPGGGDGIPPAIPGGGGGGGGALVVSLADFPELSAVGGTARVDGDTTVPIGLSRTGPSSFVAVSMICPHAAYRPIDIRPTGYRCPNHGAVFADDGTWLGGQPTFDLERYAVSFDDVAQTVTIT